MTIHKNMYGDDQRKTIMVSGGFDPVHIGHIRMILDAARHGDVVVVANSDDWLFRKKGFVFMDTPGFDPVSATGQIAGGANLIAFTTGRGSCFGAKPTPSIKLATNSSLYKKMYEDMDINCGLVIDGDKDIEEMGKIIFEEFISFASGKKTKSEILNLGRHEFAPWQIGITG